MMTLADAIRQVAADHLRLIAVRAAWSPPLHTHGVGLLSDGRLVTKAKDGQSSAPYAVTLADLDAQDWDVYPIAGQGIIGQSGVQPSGSVKTYVRPEDMVPVRPPTGGGIISQTGGKPGGRVLDQNR